MGKSEQLGSAEVVNGVVWVRLSRSADPDRTRIRLEPRQATTKEEGKAWAHRASLKVLAEKLERATPKTSCSPDATVESWCERWHDDRVARATVVDSDDDRSRLKHHILPIIGNERMATVQSALIGEIVERLDAKIVDGSLSWKTAATAWGVVKTMFRDACSSKTVDLRVRTDDPTLTIKGPERGEEKSKGFLYPSEFVELITSPVLTHGDGLTMRNRKRIVAAAKRWRRLYILAAYLGVRAGELRSIDWKDIDLTHRVIHIHKSTRDNVETDTKTGVTRRYTIEANLLPLLEQMRRESGGKGKLIKVPPECDLSSRLKFHLRLVGVSREELFIDDRTRCSITFKDLRATYLTWRAIRGDDPLRIQRSAGHKTLTTTQIYIRVAEDLGAQAGEPFPPIPAHVIGASNPVAKGDTAESVPDHRPNAGPKLAQEMVNYANLLGKIVTPTGIEREEPTCSTGETGSFGPTGPADRDDGPSSRALAGSQIAPVDVVAEALATALAKASEAGQWNVVAQLADVLEARRVARRPANVVSIDAKRAR